MPQRTPPLVQLSPLAHARAGYLAAFSVSPTHAASAPGRVNLIGEHTDYSGGLVLPMALSLRCFAVGGLSPSGKTQVVAADVNDRAEFDIALARPDDFPRGHWARYIAGVLSGLAKLANLVSPPPLRIAVSSAVPSGAGLSSSAALEVAVATLAADLWRVKPTPPAIAQVCQAAENTFAGVPCGIMDQLISASARCGHALRIDCRSLETVHVPLPDPDAASIVIANSNVKHALGAGEYASRRAACESAAQTLGVKTLRDATLDLIRERHAELPDDQLMGALHVLGENQRVLRFCAALGTGDLPGAGSAMIESHRSLRDDFRVSCRELDVLVDAALDTPDVYGSRMTGGGFGGCTVTLCKPEAVEPLTRTLHAAFANRSWRLPEVFIARSDDGARREMPAA